MHTTINLIIIIGQDEKLRLVRFFDNFLAHFSKYYINLLRICCVLDAIITIVEGDEIQI